jgi:hypothetical protein
LSYNRIRNIGLYFDLTNLYRIGSPKHKQLKLRYHKIIVVKEERTLGKDELHVYTDVKVYKVPSTHGPNINYLVCYGYVDWAKNGDLKSAIYVLMEYKGYIKYDNPPHILTTLGDDGISDFTKVMDKISLLQSEFNIK